MADDTDSSWGIVGPPKGARAPQRRVVPEEPGAAPRRGRPPTDRSHIMGDTLLAGCDGNLSLQDAKALLHGIALDGNAQGAARINAITKLLEMGGEHEAFQKFLVTVELTGYSPNQFKMDKARFDAMPSETGGG